MLYRIDAKIQKPDFAARQAAERRWDTIAKPIAGLGKLEELICRIAAIQRSEKVELFKRAVIVMCADHGITAQGVTQTDRKVTAVVAANMAAGTASISHMSKVADADVFPVDIGMAADVDVPGIISKKVCYGTKDFSKDSAMSEKEARQAIQTGIAMVRELKDKGYKILCTGEMGIGNTTATSAIASVLLNLPVEETTGRGAGLDEKNFQHKKEIIKEALQFHGLHDLKGENVDPFMVLSKIGGLDIAGLAGVFLGGAIYGIPIIIDGIISAVSALLAVRLREDVREYLLPSHMGKEPASKAVMKELGLSPVIDGNLALGEGTGAVLLLPMLDMALSVYQGSVTFTDMQIEPYKRY